MRMFLILFVLLFCSAARAQTFGLKVLSRECNQGYCRQLEGYGTACYLGVVGDKSVFVTASHNLNNAYSASVFWNGKYIPVKVRHRVYQQRQINGNTVTPLIDYALIDCDRISYPSCFTLAEKMPPDGTPAIADGSYGDSGRMLRLRSVVRFNRNGNFFMKTVVRGQSGGPVYANGRLVGVIHGGFNDGAREAIFTDAAPIRAGLMRVYGQMPCCNCRPAVVVDVQPKPCPVVVQDSEQVKALESRLAQLQAQLDQLAKTQIPVQLIGADGEVMQEQRYALGSPLRFRFKKKDKNGNVIEGEEVIGEIIAEEPE